MWIFEPHSAEEAFEKMIRQSKIKVYRDEWHDRKTGIKKKNGTIMSFKTISGKTIACIAIDDRKNIYDLSYDNIKTKLEASG